MEKRNKFLAVGLAALLIAGLVSAFNAARWNIEARGIQANGKGMHAGGMPGFMQARHGQLFDDLGLDENASREEVMEARWSKKLEELGLTEDDTIHELHDAVKTRMQERHQENLEQLGLDEDASPEEIRKARRSSCQENPDECPHQAARKKARGFLRNRVGGKGCCGCMHSDYS